MALPVCNFMVKDLDYAFAVARIRANERYMLTSSDVETIISADGAEKAISFLSSKKWFTCSENSSIKEITENAQKNMWALLSESVPDKRELEIFTVQNDFFNIKAVLKCVFSGVDPDEYYVYPTSIDPSKIKQAVLRHDYKLIEKDFVEPLTDAVDALNKTENGQMTEIILDRAALRFMLTKAKNSKCSIIKEITEFFVAVSNIKIAVKCINSKKGSTFARNAMVSCKSIDVEKLIKICDEDMESLLSYLMVTDYKKAAELISSDTVLFEKWCDDIIIEIAKKSKFEFFGFGPICGYYYGKLNEIKTVKSILIGKENGFSQEMIRERVRTLYA